MSRHSTRAYIAQQSARVADLFMLNASAEEQLYHALVQTDNRSPLLVDVVSMLLDRCQAYDEERAKMLKINYNLSSDIRVANRSEEKSSITYRRTHSDTSSILKRTRASSVKSEISPLVISHPNSQPQSLHSSINSNQLIPSCPQENTLGSPYEAYEDDSDDDYESEDDYSDDPVSPDDDTSHQMKSYTIPPTPTQMSPKSPVQQVIRRHQLQKQVSEPILLPQPRQNFFQAVQWKPSTPVARRPQ